MNKVMLNKAGADGIVIKGGSGGGSSAPVVKEIAYADLVALRNSAGLVAGAKYRIIDYETTVNSRKVSVAGHPFDVIVTALDNKTLDEKASAIQSARDTEGYFANSNLAAWDIRYTLNNDRQKYPWVLVGGKKVTFTMGGASLVCLYAGVMEIEGMMAHSWLMDDPTGDEPMLLLTLSDNPTINDDGFALIYDPTINEVVDQMPFNAFESISITDAPSGRGVIYRMTDEWGNSCPYDFKNVLFVRSGAGGQYGQGGENPRYTFNHYYYSDEAGNVNQDYSLKGGKYCSYNVIGDQSWNNVFLTIDEFPICSGNKLGSFCVNNTFNSGMMSNSLGDCCADNTFLGKNCQFNHLGNGCIDCVFAGENIGNTLQDQIEGQYRLEYGVSRTYVACNSYGEIKQLKLGDLAN